MRSRRITIFCVAMIALAGTPRVWREVSNLLAVVQHKAQVKFWSMVLQPGAGQSTRLEMVAAAQPLETVEAASTCPLQNADSKGNQVVTGLNASRRNSTIPAQAKARAPEQPLAEESAPASHAGLIARAPKAPRGDTRNAESLLRSRHVWESQPPEVIARNAPAALVLPAAATLPHAPASKNETFRFVLIPGVNPAGVSALTEKEAALQFKLIRKSLEDGKLLRQKSRLPVKGMAVFPAS